MSQSQENLRTDGRTDRTTDGTTDRPYFIGPFRPRLGVQLNFNEHLSDIISKASHKVNALSRVVPYMSLSKKKILMNSFFNSQFSYCPLIWMFHSRIMNNKINRLHERCMRLIYGDKTSSFEELLEKNKSISIQTMLKKCLKCIEACLLLFISLT